MDEISYTQARSSLSAIMVRVTKNMNLNVLLANIDFVGIISR
jgi:hypothetical protein